MDIGHKTITALIDAGIVKDYASEYGEPGYSTSGNVLLGDYWCENRECGYPTREDGRRELHSVEVHYPRVMAALESQGHALEWYDEWTVDHENDKAWRTEPNSYSWQPSTMWTDDGDILTPDDDVEAWVAELVNNPTRAMPRHVHTDDELRAIGFAEYACGYESGWHPGQTDDPREITRLIRAERGESIDILFKLSAVGQFDLSFCVFVREPRGDADDE